MALMRWFSVLALVACGTPAADDSEDSKPVGDPPEAPPIVINEFLATNEVTNMDDYDEYDDWLELYNTGEELVSFPGLYLTDDLEDPTKWPLPGGEGLQPGDYFLIWCDSDPEQGEAHASFKLGKEAGVLALYIVADGYDPLRVDGINYSAQAADLSSARVPDGTDDWRPDQEPSPLASNGQ